MAPSSTTERLRQALAAVAALVDQTNQELLHVDADFQQKMLQAIQEAEAAKQTIDQLKQALADSDRKTQEFTEELKAQSDQDISAAIGKVRKELGDERDELRRALQRLTQAGAAHDEERAQLLAERDHALQSLEETKKEQFQLLSDTEQAAAIALERQIASAIDRARSELNTDGNNLRQELATLSAASEQWKAEREQLTVELERTRTVLSETETEHARILDDARKDSASKLEQQVNQVRAELTAESERFRIELEQLARSAAQWNSERTRLTEEAERTKRVLAETKAELDRANASKATSAPAIASEALQEEITRVEGLIRATTQLIDNPATELSIVFRKNAERSELESYLKGIRFSMQGK